MKNIGIIGLGLIGGSYGLALRKTGNYKVFGKDISSENIKTALETGIIEKVLTDDILFQMDGIIIAVPVNHIPELSKEILKNTNEKTWIFDTGSIKHNIWKAIQNLPGQERFVLSHPIAGTEYSGPKAAKENLFQGKINIICNPEHNSPEVLEEVVQLHENLGMTNHFLQTEEHDKHIAYVSHLSHISSFVLGKTVLDVEPDEKNVFLMAGSGFASTVRLAKSSPDTWTPIFMENKSYLLPVIKRYMENLKKIAILLKQENEKELHKLLSEINNIGEIINRIENEK